MTTAYWCVLIGAFMPLMWTATAKFGGSQKMSFGQNSAPREFLETVSGMQKRAHWAQLNAFEAFPAFAAAVIISHLAGGAQSTIDLLAMGWVAARVAYGICYLADWGTLRSLVWGAAVACVVALFVIAA
ncbi:putative MAPEG superfamily protein [Panacagrimonas perspica]|uniref:Putative MAPEG superfamily protein n=1 Tax=Panacagrimonas perspica TaxID=381431 RepID=A0A4S3K673_9GAMM|nr:MAPEG family protein [Panacagrimonas perspica]TDU26889.1 putative MAPEG superfamily protein [Panacagrimonas perspica]THD03657.1 hypothetical protein B1810_08930 [Panacagrimonas perspica]